MPDSETSVPSSQSEGLGSAASDGELQWLLCLHLNQVTAGEIDPNQPGPHAGGCADRLTCESCVTQSSKGRVKQAQATPGQ